MPRLALGLLLSFFAGAALSAESVVLSSTAPGMVVGRVLGDGEVVRLPEDSVTTVLRSDGVVAKLRGPFEGAVDAAFGRGGEGAETSLFAGWTGIEVSSLGGARGGVADAGMAASSGGPVVVDPTRSGTWCAIPGADLRVGAAVELEDPANGRRVAVGRGGAWPAELPVVDGAAYVARSPSGTHTLRFVRLPTDLPPGPERAMRMAKAGCSAQAVPALRRIGISTTPFALHLSTERGRTPRYALGERIEVVVQVNRPAVVSCFAVRDDGASALFPAPLQLADHQPLHIPGDQVAGAVAADPPPGLVEVRCYATDSRAAAHPRTVAASDGVELLGGQEPVIARMFIRLE